MKEKMIIISVALVFACSTFLMSPLLAMRFNWGLDTIAPDTFKSERDEVKYLRGKIDDFVKQSQAKATPEKSVFSNATVSPLDRVDYYLLYNKDGTLKQEVAAYVEKETNGSALNATSLIDLLSSGQLKAEVVTEEKPVESTPAPAPPTTVVQPPPETPTDLGTVFGDESIEDGMGETIDLNDLGN